MQAHVNKCSPTISIIIPTTCESRRSALLRRAIKSIESQADARAEIVVVVNGSRYCTEALEELRRNGSVRVVQIPEPNVSLARHRGVTESRGRFFCFLDDDDELLPNAIDARLSLLDGNPDADIVVTNGFIFDATDSVHVPPGSGPAINKDPAGTFLRRNWFASASCTFRRDSVEDDLFKIDYKFFEWTYLFFLLLSKGKRFHFDECLTYRVHADTASSASKSSEYSRAYPDSLLRIAQLPLPREIQKEIHRKYCHSLNTLSQMHLEQGKIKDAWKSHLKCISKGGWKFLPYTRHLLRAR